jgi:hypothetical protein
MLAAAAAALALAGVLGPGAAPVSAATGDSLALTTRTTYTIVPSSHVVRAVVDVAARNNKPNRVSGDVITRYFYDSFRIGVQPEARSIAATSGGVRVAASTKPADGYTTVEVRFRSSLFYHQTTQVRVTYDLPGGAPRSKSEIRVGPAFATFVAWAFGDSASVRIVVPKGFEADSTGADVTKTTSAGTTVLSASGITDVGDWYVVVNADRQSALTSDRVSLPGGEELIVHSWPDDPAWNEQVTDLLKRGLPELVELTGLSWPVAGDLSIFEVHTPLLEGYAGVFFEGQNRIEVSEDLDDLTILHEASHAWFNSDLFVGRWINEGFADTFASKSLDAIGLGGWAPGSVSPTDAAAVKLNEWAFPGRITDKETDAREQFGYDASWSVIRSIDVEVGHQQMRAMLNAAEAHQIAYRGAGDAETVAGPNDWRRVLDLLDQVGRSKTADDLFRRWVVSSNDLPILDKRAKARTVYAALTHHGGDWLPPIYVRQPMSDWSFDTATTRIAEAESILAKRDQLARLAGGLGLAVPTTLRTAYQTASQSLDSASQLADRAIADAAAIANASAAVNAPRDPITALGLMGTAPEARLAEARAAFGRNATDTAAQAATVTALLAGAPDIGRGRLLAAVVLAVLVALAIVGAILLQRRRRRLARTAAGATVAGAGSSAAYATLAAPTEPPSSVVDGPGPEAAPIEPPAASSDHTGDVS